MIAWIFRWIRFKLDKTKRRWCCNCHCCHCCCLHATPLEVARKSQKKWHCDKISPTVKWKAKIVEIWKVGIFLFKLSSSACLLLIHASFISLNQWSNQCRTLFFNSAFRTSGSSRSTGKECVGRSSSSAAGLFQHHEAESTQIQSCTRPCRDHLILQGRNQTSLISCTF